MVSIWLDCWLSCDMAVYIKYVNTLTELRKKYKKVKVS